MLLVCFLGWLCWFAVQVCLGLVAGFIAYVVFGCYLLVRMFGLCVFEQLLLLLVSCLIIWLFGFGVFVVCGVGCLIVNVSVIVLVGGVCGCLVRVVLC